MSNYCAIAPHGRRNRIRSSCNEVDARLLKHFADIKLFSNS